MVYYGESDSYDTDHVSSASGHFGWYIDSRCKEVKYSRVAGGSGGGNGDDGDRGGADGGDGVGNGEGAGEGSHETCTESGDATSKAGCDGATRHDANMCVLYRLRKMKRHLASPQMYTLNMSGVRPKKGEQLTQGEFV